MRVPRDAETDAEAWVLTTDDGRALLAAVEPVASPRPADLERWRKLAAPEAVSAAVRLAACRARGKAKFTRASQMWLDPVALEQATAESVARHKAARFHSAGGRVIDLCAGIGGDAVALAERATVCAVDCDQGMCRRTAWNAAVYAVADRLDVIRARAERFALPSGSLVHIDPDRRAGASRRALRLEGYVPDLEFLRSLPRRVFGGAIKLGPASDFAEHFDQPDFEVEVISLGGECKEATVWFGNLASCRRRATCLPAGATVTERDLSEQRTVPVLPPASWVYDPDPALIRSGLLDGFATAHGLARCADGIDFLTSPELLVSPFLTAFETLEVLPLDVRKLKRIVAERRLGPLEIKTKGLDLRPETLRPILRPPGPNAATLLLIGGRGPAQAIISQRTA